jgi:hypothetical protein
MEGIAELLRQSAKTLDLNPDLIVPPVEVIKQRMINEQAMQQQQMQAAQTGGQVQAGGSAPAPRPGAQLQNGAPVANSFAPQAGIAS